MAAFVKGGKLIARTHGSSSPTWLAKLNATSRQTPPSLFITFGFRSPWSYPPLVHPRVHL